MQDCYWEFTIGGKDHTSQTSPKSFSIQCQHLAAGSNVLRCPLVHSLSQSATGELWVTLANQKPYLHKGQLGYVALPNKKLLRFHSGQWLTPQLPGFTSFNQVEFVPGTTNGYALTETGEVLETGDNGEKWHRLTGGGVKRMHAWQHAIAWLREGNELVLY